MVRDAMTRVKEWPSDRDMFVEVPHQSADSILMSGVNDIS
jgi:hypothetical protein